MSMISWVKNKTSKPLTSDEFIEMDHQKPIPKITIKKFQLQSFDDTKKVISELREGKTVALVDMKPLREKDVIDLKRSINKLKSACMEIGADIASLGGDWIVLAPSFAEIYKPSIAKNGPEIVDIPNAD